MQFDEIIGERRNNMTKRKDPAELEKKINYTFQNKKILKKALTHSSFANERHLSRLHNNERLEFLGDAVLELVTSEYLFLNETDMPEGEMTKIRASLVCEPSLEFCTREIQLGEFLFLGKGEEMTGGRNRASILSDAMEALIGAVYLDGGFASAKDFIHRFILSDVESKKLFYDSKTILQELVQGESKGELTYHLASEEGPDHDKRFIIQARLDERIIGTGVGKSKKAAEQEAAYKAILKLKNKITKEK